MNTINDIANEIKDLNEFIILIYAYNGTGKTRLSVAFKNITKEANYGSHSGVYYNAFSEDLFLWDNDEDNSNFNIKLDLSFSSLNTHYSSLTEDSIREQLQYYYPSYNFRFILNDDPTISIESIVFFKEDEEEKNIKISRGEERIFVWCFFLALFKVEGLGDVQDAHFFIDDPVSSLDDHNIFITADTIMDLIEENFEKNKTFVITTHHIGLFSVLYDRVKRGEKADRYKNVFKAFMLKQKDNELYLKKFEKEVFLFHLHLIQTLSEAQNSNLYTYHFVLLRQLLENIASFIGTSQIKILLEEIKVEYPDRAISNLNSLSHKKVFIPQFKEMNENELTSFNDVFNKILIKYNFNF